MNPEYIFIKTAAGEEALRLHRKALPRSLRTVLILVDGRTTAAELGVRLSNPAQTENALGDLERQGYIERIGERSRDASSADPGAIASPPPSVVTEAAPVVTPDNSPDSVADEAETGGMEEAPIIVVRRGGRQRRTGPVFWALRLTGWGVGAILLIVLSLRFFPYSIFLPEVQSAVSRTLGMPVGVGALRVSLSPRPGIVLERVSVETARTGKLVVGQVLLLPAIGTVLSPVKTLREVILSDVSVPVEDLSIVSGVFDRLAKAESPVRVDRLRFEHTEVSVAGLTFENMEGDVNRAEEGGAVRVRMRNADGSLAIAIAPGDEAFEMSLEASGWRVPGNVTIDSASIRAVLKGGMLAVSAIDLNVFDGRVRGEAALKAQGTPDIVGTIAFERINSARLASALGIGTLLSGDLAGKLRFSAAADSWPGLWTSLKTEGDFVMQRGSLQGIDLAEAVRRATGESVQGGATRFDRFSGRLQWVAGGGRLSQLALDAGLMQSSGSVEIGGDMSLKGRMDLQIQGSANQTRASIAVGGTLTAPTVQANGR